MSLPSLNLDGKVGLVTGTGSGLGRAISIGMAQAGADVALTELPDRLDSARETAREIEKLGRRAFVVPLDVTKLPLIQETVHAVRPHFAPIDILANNPWANAPRLPPPPPPPHRSHLLTPP